MHIFSIIDFEINDIFRNILGLMKRVVVDATNLTKMG